MKYFLSQIHLIFQVVISGSSPDWPVPKKLIHYSLSMQRPHTRHRSTGYLFFFFFNLTWFCLNILPCYSHKGRYMESSCAAASLHFVTRIQLTSCFLDFFFLKLQMFFKNKSLYIYISVCLFVCLYNTAVILFSGIDSCERNTRKHWFILRI